MALPKLCYRTVSSNNFEPSKCIGATCSMWGEVGGLQGCLPALVATFQCIEIMDRQSAKCDKPQTDYERDQELLKEKKHEGEIDSGTSNILEGGADALVQHDSNGCSSPS